MPVPPHNVLCRFVKEQRDCWDDKGGRPRANAFKDNREPNFSAWSVTALEHRKVRVEELMVGTFRRYGRVHLSVQDCVDAAREASEMVGTAFGVLVEWRPRQVTPELQHWSFAHAQVEYSPDDSVKSVVVKFRQRLALRAKAVSPPDRFAGGPSDES